MTDPRFWQDRSVMITGHTGFKGSWLSLWLQRLGARVTGIALDPPTSPSLFDLAGVGEGMESVRVDIREPGAVMAAMDRARPEVVIHMAAQALVQHSYAEPVETYGTNVMGTVHLLEAVRRTGGVRAVVVVTSDKCYENHDWAWGYRESDPLGGYDPYSNSKACAELVAGAYRDSFFNPAAHERHGTAVATARAGNVVGGGDWAANRLVPDLVSGFLRRQPVSIRNPGSVRPWQHVLEPLSGYLLLAQRLCERGPDFSGSWNFGPFEGDARPVGWVADRLARHWGEGASWTRDSAGHPHEAQQLRLDWSKARTQLGWAPRWELDETLRRCVSWYRACAGELDRARVRAAIWADIAAYEAAQGGNGLLAATWGAEQPRLELTPAIR